MLHALDHVIVLVRDLPAATADTARLLGRRPSWRGVHPEAGTANTLFRLENAYLELLAIAGPGALAAGLAARLDREGEGLLGLAFATDDADACAREFRGRGLPAAAPRPGRGRETDTGATREWRNVVLPLDATRGVLLFAIQHSSAVLLPATAESDPSAAVAGIDHVVVQSTDLEAARRLYGDELGLRLALDRSFPERSARILFFRIGAVTVEVAGGLEAAADPSRDRLWGLAYRVLDVAAARRRLAAAGVDVSEAREGRKPGTVVCTVRSGTCGVPTLLIGPEG